MCHQRALEIVKLVPLAECSSEVKTGSLVIFLLRIWDVIEAIVKCEKTLSYLACRGCALVDETNYKAIISLQTFRRRSHAFGEELFQLK